MLKAKGKNKKFPTSEYFIVISVHSVYHFLVAEYSGHAFGATCKPFRAMYLQKVALVNLSKSKLLHFCGFVTKSMFT